MKMELQGIEKTYDRPVLRGISHTFEAGKLYVIKGVSGCGKSTLLNILGGVETDYEGDILWNGTTVYGKEDVLRSETGYIFQKSLLLSGISVRENLLLIVNDPDRISALCEQVGVSGLLDKYPSELSGGERQRVSSVRALLREPKLILADEPTASLDGGNSEKIARLISSLATGERIVIVATHEHYFDEYADEILHLDYGVIGEIEKPQCRVDRSIDTGSIPPVKPCRAVNETGYSYKRQRGKYGFFALLPLAAVFLMLMLAATLLSAFRGEYLHYKFDGYPTDGFIMNDERLLRLDSEIIGKIQVYEYYTAEENGIRAGYLSDKESSVLAVPNMLFCGEFPSTDDEILVSYAYCSDVLKADANTCIGKEIAFRGLTLRISGVVFPLAKGEVKGRNEKFDFYMESDAYYSDSGRQGELHLFISYNTLKAVGTVTKFAFAGDDTRNRFHYKMASYPHLFEDAEALAKLRESAHGIANVFDGEAISAEELIRAILLILLIVFGACFVLACIFMTTQIRVELFYRRRELGYLQIFGLDKKRISRIVAAGYRMKILLAIGEAFALYAVCVAGYLIAAGRFVIFNAYIIGALFALCYFVYMFCVGATVRKALKTKIIRLVTG